MWSTFDTRVPGKWVLTGEHAVLRGATAVALPHPEFGLSLTFQPQVWDGLSVAPLDASPVIEDLLQSIEDSLHDEGRSFARPRGSLSLQSTIPIGAGLGSSAALCVAITRWLAEPLGLGEAEIPEFATRLEHRFHGQSSGMDVAVIAAAEAVSFVRGRGPRPLGVKRLPRFTFHDTGLRCRTSECVLRVEGMREQTPALAMKIDEAMSEASRNAMEGLIQFDHGQGEKGRALIAQAMNQAQECFRDWGLLPAQARDLEQKLLEQGARAVKITGAGGGGMLVALWND